MRQLDLRDVLELGVKAPWKLRDSLSVSFSCLSASLLSLSVGEFSLLSNPLGRNGHYQQLLHHISSIYEHNLIGVEFESRFPRWETLAGPMAKEVWW